MEERRISPRMRMLKSGKIFLGTRPIACTVRNLSETGACLEFASSYGIPATFEFVLPERCRRVCRVVWANDSRMGVQFQ
jgi:hypothetical protein